ncbi:MAG TPA: DUF928 domain-containing protein [Oculatellaceae cyanobacterium]|jgi:hypothetical protein
MAKKLTIIGISILSMLPIVIQSIVTSKPLYAQSLITTTKTNVYTPPPGRKRAQRTEGVGSRGGECQAPVSLHLLAPSDHVAQTVAARPTFLLYVSKPKALIRYTLIEPGVLEPIVDKQVQLEKPGITKLEISETAPELTIGKEYRWTVTIICNQERPSENIYAHTTLIRITKTSELASRLATASTERSVGLIYAESGIWYDAIASLYKAYENTPHNTEVYNEFKILLDSIGLSQIFLSLTSLK